ncbi:hypothetical protein E4T49_03931 [Aureobasidium sp. EXF-10728]|nr:hypothetical protein E4T49_03931 [Aureobasidium sp. EXF-10728]
MARSDSPALPISLFDIFLGSARTIRRPTGPPGAGKTELVRVRRRPSAPKPDEDETKAASAKSSNKENAASGSKHSDKKEDNKSSSKKDESKSDDKAADANKAADEPKTNGNKPQAGAQNTSDVVFTPEEDAKILLMAAEGKKMPEIAEAIGKSKKQTGRRFAKIKAADGKAQKGGKPGNDKAGAVEDKKDHNDKQLANMGKKDKKVEDRRSKSNAVDRSNRENTPSAAVHVGGRLEHQHAHGHRHEVRVDHHHDHHIHHHDSHPRRSNNTHKPRHQHTRHDSAHHPSRPHKTHHRPPATVASSRTAFTLQTMPSLAEDDLFSFGELQALSELISKDMEGMWQRVSAAFFGMTGRRIAAEDIRDKFAGLQG